MMPAVTVSIGTSSEASTTLPSGWAATAATACAAVEEAVGGGDDHDAVAPFVIDLDQRGTRGVIDLGDEGVVDVLAIEFLAQPPTGLVEADASAHVDPGTVARRCDGLIESLAARGAGETATDERLTGLGHPRAPHDEVGVETADDEDARGAAGWQSDMVAFSVRATAGLDRVVGRFVPVVRARCERAGGRARDRSGC